MVYTASPLACICKFTHSPKYIDVKVKIVFVSYSGGLEMTTLY